MSDKDIKQLFRNGEIDRWHIELLRSGQLDLYKNPIGPFSILETECATEDCSNKLEWSNCSYCMLCHQNKCDAIDETERQNIRSTRDVGYNRNGFISETVASPCGELYETNVLGF